MMDAAEGSPGLGRAAGFAAVRLRQQRRQMELLTEMTKNLCEETKKANAQPVAAPSAPELLRLRCENEELRMAQRKKESELSAAKSAHWQVVSQLEQRIHALETNVAAAKAAVKEVELLGNRRVLELRKLVSDSEEKNSLLTAKVEKAEAEMSALRAQTDRGRAEAEEERKRLDEQFFDLQKSLQKEREDRDEAQQQVMKLTGQLAEKDEELAIERAAKAEATERLEKDFAFQRETLESVISGLQRNLREVAAAKESDMDDRALYAEMKAKCTKYAEQVQALQKEVVEAARQQEALEQQRQQVDQQKRQERELEETTRALRETELVKEQRERDLQEWEKLAASFVLDEPPSREAFRRYLLLLVNALQALQFEKTTANAQIESLQQRLKETEETLKARQETEKLLEAKLVQAEQRSTHLAREASEAKQQTEILKIRLAGALSATSEEVTRLLTSARASDEAKKRDTNPAQAGEAPDQPEGHTGDAASLETKIRELHAQAEASERIISHLENAKARLESEFKAAQQLAEASVTLQREKDELATANSQLTAELQRAADRVSELHRRAEASQREATDLRVQAGRERNLQGNLQRARERIASLELQLARGAPDSQQLQRQVETLTAEVAGAKERLKLLKDSYTKQISGVRDAIYHTLGWSISYRAPTGSQEESVTLQSLYSTHDGLVVFTRGNAAGGEASESSADESGGPASRKRRRGSTDSAQSVGREGETRDEEKERGQSGAGKGIPEGAAAGPPAPENPQRDKFLSRFAKERFRVSFLNAYATKYEKDDQFRARCASLAWPAFTAMLCLDELQAIRAQFGSRIPKNVHGMLLPMP
ncbi:putative myosin heavy chain [Neospora caninum Liverpool]|uniref:Myosin heavy chain, putative n=1 Tax=Neospora caninum (strain Liverpool) TaxID=572307 RepID=F0VP29_NEOCL|nr:putative myosin heavy chain [Neospora caninum Liverpool]CBZ55475.1 putative myosin heavy chain [Neospora caninum Liverpool]CEL70212.1 TPA: myosin heavy chain, putative [Neospora caninum Liverpool]|eukprot:XP_003885503.1 putative myosin heavy chain [Neospora caninum Liverpool]